MTDAEPNVRSITAEPHRAGPIPEPPPAVLFLCTHNAGRSQIAMGFLKHFAGDRITAYSGGSEPAKQVNPAAIAAMAEKGIDISGQQPRRWTRADVEAVQVVVTMGCGDECPYIPGKRYENWDLADPAGQDIDFVRLVRDDIERRVHALVHEITEQT
jgi:protein-tyrosine-phosphatase